MRGRPALAILLLAVAGCQPAGPSLRFALLDPQALIDEIHHFDLRVWAAADADCNGAAVAVKGNAPPVGAKTGIVEKVATLTVAAGAKIFAVDGYADAAGMARIAEGCQAATLEKDVDAQVTIRLSRVGGPPPRVVYGSNLNGPGATALFLVDPADAASARAITSTPVVAPGSDYDLRGGVAVFSGISNQVQLYLANVDGPVADRPLPVTTPASAGALSPDGQKVAFSARPGGRGTVMVADLAGQNEVALSDGSADATNPAWSRDSKQVAWIERPQGMPGRVVVGAAGVAPKRLSTPDPAPLAVPVWTADGKVAVPVVGVGKDDLVLWDPTSDKKLDVLASLPGIKRPTLSADGNVLLFVAQGQGADIYRYDFKAPTMRLAPAVAGPDEEDYPAWAPDGSRIAYTVNNKATIAAPDGTGARRLTTTGGGVIEVHPLFAPVL